MKAPLQLLELQREFKSLIVNPKGLEFAVKDKSLNWIINSQTLSQQERLDIYSEAYFSRLAKYLQKAYPNCYNSVGDEYFRYLASHYYEKYPSNSPLIQETGENFPSFLNSFNHKKPWLSEWASLEWLIYESLHTDTDLVYNSPFKSINDIEQEKISLILNPTIKLYLSEWSLWVDCYNNAELLNSKSYRIIWKHNNKINLESFDKYQSKFLEILKNTPNISKACQVFQEHNEINEENFSNWFKIWFQKGIILGYSL